MGQDHHTAALLQRIAQLEAMVERLSDDLGSLRATVRGQGWTAARSGGARAAGGARGRQGGTGVSPPAEHAVAAPAKGLEAALTRGEAARVQWVRDGLVVPGEQLAQAWGLTRQALAPAAERGDIVSIKVGNRLYYPRAFLELDRASVATVCRALGALTPSEKLMFWLLAHGSLAGRTVAAALAAGVSLVTVERLAIAWAHERGAARAATAA